MRTTVHRAAPALFCLLLSAMLLAVLERTVDGLSDPAQVSASQQPMTVLEIVEPEGLRYWHTPGSVLKIKARVTNEEGADMRYYIAGELRSTEGGGQLHEIPNRLIALRSGASTVITFAYPIPSCAGRLRARVVLSGRAESVFLWIQPRVKAGAKSCG